MRTYLEWVIFRKWGHFVSQDIYLHFLKGRWGWGLLLNLFWLIIGAGEIVLPLRVLTSIQLQTQAFMSASAPFFMTYRARNAAECFLQLVQNTWMAMQQTHTMSMCVWDTIKWKSHKIANDVYCPAFFRCVLTVYWTWYIPDCLFVNFLLHFPFILMYFLLLSLLALAHLSSPPQACCDVCPHCRRQTHWPCVLLLESNSEAVWGSICGNK